MKTIEIYAPSAYNDKDDSRTKVHMEIVCMHKVRTQLFVRDKVCLKKYVC